MNDASAPLSDEAAQAAWEKRCGVLYHAWVQLRYHRKRERFFDLMDKGSKGITLVLGATLLGESVRLALPLVGGAISAVGLLALVFAYGDRKQIHRELGARAAALITEIEAAPARDVTPDTAAGWAAQYARLTANAPPPLRTLTLLCEREQAIADGHPDDVSAPGWWRTRLAHLV